VSEEELLQAVRELAQKLDSPTFEPQALQALTAAGLTLEQARAALVLGVDEGVLERTVDSHYRVAGIRSRSDR